MTTTRLPIAHPAPWPRLQADDSQRFFGIVALVVMPLTFAATLLLALPAGAGNATLIALVPTLFAAGFFGGVSWLAGAMERDNYMPVSAPAASHNGERTRPARAA